MLTRTIYLPSGVPFDLTAAEERANLLCEQATDVTLRVLAESLRDRGGPHHDPSDPAHATALRGYAARWLCEQLGLFAASLAGRDVERSQFGKGDEPRVDVYMTGGLSHGDSPTDAFDAWDILFEDSLLPDGWTDQLGNAGGLWHTHGDGRTVGTITLRTWA